jgi:hypothetical protein
MVTGLEVDIEGGARCTAACGGDSQWFGVRTTETVMESTGNDAMVANEQCSDKWIRAHPSLSSCGKKETLEHEELVMCVSGL